MTRRLQLLDPESRSSGRSVSAVIARVRDGLLRDNKVIPAVLGILALLIFAWLVAGALIGGPGDEKQQASNQASLAQGDDSDSRDAETPAPGVENRDSDASYGGYDEGPKDPFRQLIPKAGEEDGGGQGNRGGDGTMAGIATGTTGTLVAPTETGAATVGMATRVGGVTAETATRTLSSKVLPMVRAPEASPVELVAKAAPTKTGSDRSARART
jgi:hypothetical protein